jgi:uncharacterized protein (DUF983 family)
VPNLAREDFAEGLRFLSPPERRLIGSLVVRQLTLRRSAAGELESYGLEGTVKLAASRSIFSFGFIIGVIGTAMAMADRVRVAEVMWGVFLVIVACTLVRAATAIRAGRRWRGRRSPA